MLGFGIGEDESRRQDGAGDSPAPKLAHDSRTLCQVNARRKAESPRDVLGDAIQPQADGEARN